MTLSRGVYEARLVGYRAGRPVYATADDCCPGENVGHCPQCDNDIPGTLHATLFDAGGVCACAEGLTVPLVWVTSPTGNSWVSDYFSLCPSSPARIKMTLSCCFNADCTAMQLGIGVEGHPGVGGNDGAGPLSCSPFHVQFTRPFDNVSMFSALACPAGGVNNQGVFSVDITE